MVSFARRAPFVGREPELRRLQEAFAATATGQGGLALVLGEPGIGKTALCRRFAAHVAVSGGRVLTGQCAETAALALPYLPFVETLRTYIVECEPAALAEALGPGARELARLVPEVGERVPLAVPPGPDIPAEPEVARHRLFQAVAAFLRAIAAAQPVALVLEDLHDADQGTLDLLLHLARQLADMRLLVVATYRDIEVDRTHPLAATLAELQRAAPVERLHLRGLTAAEVQQLLEDLATDHVPEELAALVQQQTEGNPLFVLEVPRYFIEVGHLALEDGRWRATGRAPLELSIPEGLRDVIGRRLSRLSPTCNRLLAIAAVIGREFRLDVLGRVAEVREDELWAALEEAVRAAVVRERAVRGPVVTYRFSHAFFRQTLYEELIAPRRNRLHQQVGRVLEEVYAARVDEHAAELAEHFSYSSDPADLAKAIAYGEWAARRALALYVYGEAARLLEQALAVQEALGPTDAAKRCDLLLALGEALMPAGEPQRVVEEVAPEALVLSEAMDDRGRAARACLMALGALVIYGGQSVWASPQYRGWAERADRLVTPGTAERVRADLHLSDVRIIEGRAREAWDLSRRALDLARRLDQPEILVAAVHNLLSFPMAPQHYRERLALAEEFAERTWGGISARPVGRVLRHSAYAYLEWGQRERAEALVRRVEELAARTRDPSVLLVPLVFTAILATLDGRLDAAVDAGARVATRAEELGSPAIGQRFATWVRVRPLLLLGRVEEALAALPEPARLEEDRMGLAEQRVLCLAHLNRRAEAEAALRQLTAKHRIGREPDEAAAVVLLQLLETAVLIEDRQTAGLLADRLTALAPLAVIEWAPATCVARHVGAAAALLDNRAAARAYYEQALEVAGQIRFRPEIALTRLQLAELLFEHYPRERAAAQSHLEFAVAEFQEMQMQPALERARRLAAYPGSGGPRAAAPSYPDGLTAREVEVLRLVAAGRSNAEIAGALVLSVRTIERHVETIYSKIGARGKAARTVAATYAHRHGLIMA